MTTRELLAGAGIVQVSSPDVYDLNVTGLAYDSRKAQAGFLFFAFAGSRQDGRRFAIEAMRQGALAVVYEELPPELPDHPWIHVQHGRHALAIASKRLFGSPDQAITITAFTGTNGKSTGTLVTDGILRHNGRTTSLINTISYHLCGQPLPAVNTTPESLDIFELLVRTRDLGGTHLTMEVSSHALELGRVHGLQIHSAVFTNLTRDHLDFHGTMESYFASKARMFGEEFQPLYAILNADDEWTRRIAISNRTTALTYGIRSRKADLRATNIQSTFQGLRFDIDGHATIDSLLVGEINVYNILAAAGACRTMGLSWDEIVQGVRSFTGVPGRFERVEEGQPFLVVVDYAHTDDALRNVIRVARQLLSTQRGKGRIITLFGCGGDRDRTKRPLMGMAAAELSDLVILTSDNPRSEDPLAIMNDALVGLRRFDTPHHTEPDRGKAIKMALFEAQEGDIVILAGKGHETYQILKDRTIAFDDREVARRALRSLGYGREEQE